MLRTNSRATKVLALFDMDGTLLTMWPTHEKAYASMFEELYGVPNVNFRNYYVPGETDEEDVWRTMRALGKSDDFIRARIDQVAPTLAKYFSEYCKDAQVTVLGGVKELLDILKGKVASGVVTGNPPEKYKLLLEKSGLNGYFSFVAGADVSEKREGRLLGGIRLAEECTGVHYESRNVYFFDDSDGSIPVSKKLGINSVAVATGDVPYERLEAANPNYLLKDLRDTQTILKIISIGRTDGRKSRLKSR